MAVKSIIEIEVDDGPFNDFKVAFDKYQKALNESPAAWAKVGKATAPAAAATRSLADQQEKFNKHAKSSESSMVRMAKHTKTMVGDIKSATESLLKWSGIVATISGLIGAGGLFGIDRLAASASNSRFRAMGLGISTAELNSANVNYSRAVGDPASTLGAIRDAQYDLSKRWAFSAMGVNPAGKDAGQLLGPMIKAARASFIAAGSTQQGAEAHGLTQFFSMDDLVRFKSMSTAEIDAMIKRADADKKALALSDSASRSWQDLKIQLDRAETQIGNTFIKGLLPLTGPLTQLSAAFTQAVGDVMKSKDMAVWINNLAAGIKTLAGYLTSDGFRSDVSNFMDSLDDAAGAIYNFAERVGKLFGTGEVTLKGSQYHKLREIARTDPALSSALRNFMENPSRQKYDSAVAQRWVELHPGLSIRGGAQIAATQQSILRRFGLLDPTTAPQQTAPAAQQRVPQQTAPAAQQRVPQQTAPAAQQRVPQQTAPAAQQRVPQQTAPAAQQRVPQQTAPAAQQRVPQQTAPAAQQRVPQQTAPAAQQRVLATGMWNSSPRHNPGNLRAAPGYPSVGGFAVFPDDATGIRAMAAQLRRYGTRGVNTVDSIVSRYAPPGANNDTGAYIREVVRQTGYGPEARLNMNDPKTLANLIAAMTKHEGGKAHFTPSSVITIMNNTGGNTYATANQLAH